MNSPNAPSAGRPQQSAPNYFPESPHRRFPPFPLKRVSPATPIIRHWDRIGPSPKSDPILLKICSLIVENPQEELLIEDLPKILASSRAQIYRRIKTKTGQSPSRFICRIRLELAVQLLRNTLRSVTDISLSVGFNDPKYFCRVFRREFGTVPSSVRKVKR